MASNTAFPLGIYVGNPDGNNATANASWEANFRAFETTMGGAKPTYMDSFVDLSVAPSQWAANAAWSAWSWAQTGSSYVGVGGGVTPVVGVPLATNATGWSNVDTFFKGIIAGTYDADFKGIVDAWANQGYKTFQLRLGYEFDGNFMPWGPGNSSSPTANADFIAAWQHVANLVHAEGKTDGVTVQTVWNPDDVNWASTPPANLYPGDQYVDIISSDAYSPTYPKDLTDWSTGGKTKLTSASAWAAIAANRVHYWQYTDATLYAQTGDGSGWSMQDLITFAKAHNKPISLSETGAGGNGSNLGPVDDPAFPQWLAGALAQAEAAGVTVQNVNIWATDQSDGSWGFLNGKKPNEAAAWDKYFGAGSGTSGSTPPPPPTIVVSAPGTVQEASVGAGVTVTETITTTNLTGTVYEEVLTSSGAVESAYKAITLTNGAATTSVFFSNSGDKIQVVNNKTTPTVTAISSPVTITDIPASPTTVTIGSGSDTLALKISEDAWSGNAQFTVSIDGKQIGGTQTATALHSAGQTQTFNVLGNFTAGKHTATVNFTNNLYNSPTQDRNLYVTGATIDGTTVSGVNISETVSGPQSFTFLAPGTTGSGPVIDSVTVNRPAPLVAGVQTITGIETDPTQSIYLDWRSNSVPTLANTDWVKATVTSFGNFSASMNIDDAGTKSTMYYRINQGPTVVAWSGTAS
jgi:hypothetical protein